MSYHTIEDHFKTNGDRHLTRAFNHLYSGHPDNYWQRSIDKAIKNYKKADSFKLDPLTEAIFEPIIKEIADKIAACFLYGVAYTKTEDGLTSYVDARDVYK